MLTQQEQDFIRYWETNRLSRKKVVRQFLIGIPVGLAFAIPIVINFSSGWYKRAQMEANSEDFNPMVLMVALLLIVGFTAIFYQRHRWDQYEQRYRELLARKQATDAAPTSNPVESPRSIDSSTPLAPSNPVDSTDPLVSSNPIDPSGPGASSNPVAPSDPAPQTDLSEKSTPN